MGAYPEVVFCPVFFIRIKSLSQMAKAKFISIHHHVKSRIFNSPGAFFNHVLFLFVFLSFMGAAFWSKAVFSDENKNPYAVEGKHPWHLQADQLTYEHQKKEYRAMGHALIQQDEKLLKADYIIFNAETMETKATGNVLLKVGEDTLSASSIEINMEKEKGVLYDGEVYLAQSHFFIKGKKIEKTDGFTYRVEDAQVTSCEGEDPDWRITGKRIDVTIDEYGYVRHGKLWVDKVPIFYTPFFMFPVKVDRQSGLLMPEFGVSRKKGIQIEQPLYWVINENSDATFYEHFMTERGHKLGLEYRYVLDRESKGTLKIDYLNDRKVDDGSVSSSEWGYDHDDFARPNDNRYWIRMKQDQTLPWGFVGKVDLDIVSDQDYLIEFKDGYTGFNTSLSDFQNDYSRILDPYEEPVRLNQININKKGDQYALNTSLKWYDDVITRKYLDEDKTLQKLPQIQLGILKKQFGQLPFYWSSTSDYTYFYSEAGTNGHRLDIHPTLYLPSFSTAYFKFEPYVGVKETVWRITEYEDSAGESEKDKLHFRQLMDFHLDFNSELNKTYQLHGSSLEAVKHVVYPEIRYTFIPNITQHEYPGFDDLQDGINRVDETNQISFYIAQFLTSKRNISASDVTDKHPEEKQVYKKILRFTLEQAYDIKEARGNSPSEYRNGKDKRPFLPLDADFELIPFDFFSISANTQWSYYDQLFIEKNAAIRIWDRRRDQFGIAYRNTRDEVETINIDGQLWVTPQLLIFSQFERNLLENETVETGVGFVYDRQCWNFKMEFIDRQEDRKYQFIINLKGLGDVGAR